MKRSVTAAMVVMLSMLYSVLCQAQILGTGQLGAARRGHSATLLQDGKILIVGGDNASGLVGQAEIFDPIALTSSNTSSNPMSLRTDHTATLLTDGRVLIIGGVDGNGLLTSSEFYNPYAVPAPSFSAGPSLLRARSGHTATVLSDGKILIVGGEASGSAEIFDPATQTISLVNGSLNTPRQYHSASLLNSGKVLIAGGVVGTNTTLTSAEIYDPLTQTFTPASGAMQTPRGLALLRVLPDGKVQVIGGDGEFSMEMFDPSTNSFIALAHIPPHDDYLNNILVSRTRWALITTIIQQNPMLQGTPELTPDIVAMLNRLDHTVTEIPQSNRAVIAGGINDAGHFLSSASVVSSSAATITTDRLDYAPGEIVTITGQGWQPNETVWMLLHEEPETREDTILSSVADNQGNITNTDFAPLPIDLNRNFTLTAIGQTSGFTAQTAFRDACNVTALTIAAQSGTLTYGTAGSVTYNVTLTKSNGNCSGSWTVTTALPSGVTASFSSGTFSGSGTSKSTTLTLTSSASTFAGSFGFTVQAGGSDTNGNVSNTGTLMIGKAGSTTTINCPTNATYTGSALTPCSATATGAGGLNVSVAVVYGNNTNVGTATADATYAGDANHNGSTASQKTFVIDKASSTTTVTCPANVTYTGSPLTPCTATVTGAGGLNQSLTVSYTNNSNAGTATASASFPGDANHNASSDSKTFTIDKASSTTTVTCPANATFTGSPLTPCTATVTGAGGLNESLTVNYTNNTNAGTATASATFVGDANHIGSTDSKNFTIDKASSTTAVICPATVTFTGSALTPCSATVTGAGGLNQSLTVIYSNNMNAGTATANASFVGDANHNGSSDSKTFEITKAPVTATAGSGSAIFDGTTKSPSACVVSGAYTGDLSCANNPASVGPGAGTTTIVPVVSGTGLSNFEITSVNGSYTIEKAASTTTVTCPASVVYNGTAQTPCSVLVTGAGGLNLTPLANYSNNINVGTATASYTFAETANHLGSSGSKTFDITKAPVTATAGSGSATYDGLTKSPSLCMVTGAYTGDLTCVNNPAVVGPDAGTTTIMAMVSGTGLSNFEITPVNGSYTINKAESTTNVTCPASVTYNGTVQTPCSVLVTGAGGLSLTPPADYSNNVNAGTATASYTFAETANHLGSSDSKTFLINKAAVTATAGSGSATYDGFTKSPAVCMVTGTYIGDLTCANSPASVGPDAGTTTIVPVVSGTGIDNFDVTPVNGSYVINQASSTTVVTCPASVTYNGAAQTPCSATVTGAGGLNQSLAVNHSDNINAGTATASASYLGDVNHLSSNDSKNFTIDKANANCMVSGYTGTYDGVAHGATGTCTGVGGAILAGLNLGASFTDFPGGTANWSFAGGTNYNNQSGSVDIAINKANATVEVYGYSGVYNGVSHRANGTARGVGGVDLSAGLNLGAAFTNVPGGTAYWVFNGGTNYHDASGNAAIVIYPKVLAASVSANSKHYDGNAIATINSCTFVGVISGDLLSCEISGYSAWFNNKYAGTAKPVNATGLSKTGIGAGNYSFDGSGTGTADIYALGFEGFLSPIGGADSTGGDYANPIRTIKLGSTLPVKFIAFTNGGTPWLTGVHTIRAIKYSNMTTYDDPITVTATDAATTGNEFRLTDGQWHFNMSTKPGSGFSKGIWKIEATLEDGTKHYAWIGLKQ